MMNVPRVFHNQLPEKDQEVAFHIGNQLRSLDLFVQRFHASLQLISHVEDLNSQVLQKRSAEKDALRGTPEYAKIHSSQPDFMETLTRHDTWVRIARRDAVITIWDFSKTIYDINENLRKRCPSLSELVSRSCIEKTLQQLGQDFPHRKQARHAAAHPADFGATTSMRERHSSEGPFAMGGFISLGEGRFSLGSVSIGDKMVWTMDGEVIQVIINVESYEKLRNIALAFFDCFADADRVMSERLHASVGVGPPNQKPGRSN